ncbi:RluA family pseudouridine synthase [Geobacter sp.]|uniref:RluA family pseudouridine synthase n=1 Tax=Geobacter sp. TaxID=46610 RepID=UPI0027B92825|nr:RluA family pseudouridine synthase [Geobacter sp.]
MPAAKRPQTRHHPKGLTILYEDKDVIVVEKPCGLLTIGTDRDKSRTVHTILNEYVRKGDPRSRNRVYIVHHLDRDTSGILILAKSEAAKMYLQEHWQDTDKRYLTVVHGRLAVKAGTISSCLAENSALKVYSTPDAAQGKLSHTEYAVIKEAKGFSLLEIHLLTGRKHQIRVHLSEMGNPVVGDRKYGKGNEAHGNLALHARSLSFTHPVSGKRLTFETPIPDYFTRLVGSIEKLAAAPAGTHAKDKP